MTELLRPTYVNWLLAHPVFPATEFHFQTPESSQGILLLNIESKVEPSMENIGLENDYIDFNGDTQEDDYIDFTGIW